jgi:cardiolipin synthase (CMP-forming)
VVNVIEPLLNVPNVLSLSRALFLPVLFILVLMDMRTAFLVGYIILGSTDFFDGLFARLLHQKTELGKKLDSIADVLFYLSTAWFLYRLYPEYLEPNYTLLNVFFGFFFISFVVSGITCKKPIVMHTFLLKLNAVFVYFMMIFSYFIDTSLFIAVILVTYMIAFVEEMIIFVRYGEVDPDTLSVFSLSKRVDP